MKKSEQKKKDQLGMNKATAGGRLNRDIIFAFITRCDIKCHRCDQSMTREEFTIDHIVPWLDSEDPVGLYFDMNNIAFSHHICNSAAARRPHAKFFTDEERRDAQRGYQRKHNRREYTPEKRHEQYLRTGK